MALDRNLVEAVIWQESRGNKNAVSPAGARGLMQIMPKTARSPGFGIAPVDPDQLFDPKINRRFGEQYLGAMLDRYQGDRRRALAAYNWGPGNADKWDGDLEKLPAETRQYIKNIEAKIAISGGDGSDTMRGGGGNAAEIEAINAELARRAEIRAIDAELARRGPVKGSASGNSAPNEPNKFTQAATVMVNDINAGFQGVSPVAVAKSPPLGVVERDEEGNVTAINVDGVREDPKNYPGSGFVTQVDPKSGLEIVYKRTGENDDSPLASAGRVLGFGLPNSLPSKIAAAAPAKSAAEGIGVTPSLGMTGKTGAMLAASGDSFIGTGGVMARDASRASDEISAAANKIADSVGPGINAADGGGALQKGAGEFVDAFKAKSDELYKAVDEAIPQGTRVEVRNAGAAIESILGPYQNTPNIGTSGGVSKIRGWADDLINNEGAIPWETLSAWRSEVGRSIGKMKGPMSDLPDARLKEIYAALTKDMEAGAKANGALGQWHRANTFYDKSQQRISEALDVVFKSKSDEQAFDRVFKLTADKGGQANIAKLNKLKKSIPPEEWGEFVGTVIRRMGKPAAGAADVADGAGFSAATFLTEWNKMSPSARSVLFRGKGVPKTLAPALDQLAEVASDAKNAGLEINRSRSGSVAAQIGTGGALATAPVPTVLALMVANATARTLTRPGVIRAIASFGKTGKLSALQRLANSKGPAVIEATNMLRLAKQGE